jgi:hypothetical protein
MGRTYRWDENPFQDFLFKSLMFGADISDKDFEADIYVGFVTILEYFVPHKIDTQYLDFEIKGNDGYYKVVAKNAISALWLSGIFPKNPKQVNDTNEYVIENMKYKFNTKMNKLTYQFVKK